ncbi:uncharacterized protein LOC117130237 [Brassica rapa]|uniref:uncharacterized protein LOC117130237 n=1 Tax=Brassica campestris TaxID=3711 RepID=UPI00142E2879|nr:uncharacterized protein LOC117130237 [Brassica rapa]
MDMKHESSGAVKIQEENKWVWPRWVKTALGSCEIWSNQVKGEPLMERAADGGQTARLKCEDQLSLEESISLEKIEDVYENKINLRRMYEVRKMICELKQGKKGFNQHVKKLRCLWSELQSLRPRSCDPRVLEEWREQDVVFSLLASLDSSHGWLVKLILKEEKLPNMEEVCVLVQRLHQVMEENKEITWSKEGAKRKKGRLRRRSKAQIRRGRCWKRSILSGYQGSYCTMKMGRVEAQQILMGECSYSAYMGESVESSGVMRKLETKGADERVTKEEWDEFVKYVYAHPTNPSLLILEQVIT